MRFSLADINPKFLPEIERQLSPRPLARKLPDAIVKHDVGPKPLDFNKDEERGGGRIEVCITRYGTRALDADNGAGGCKPLLDQIRYQNLIPNDDPESIEFVFKQRRVKTRKECGTLITITPL